MIDITPADQEIVTAILKKHVPHAEVRVFGSRHKWTAKPYSDLDLAIVADAKLDKQIIYDLEEAFEESELSFRVDIIDWYAISDEFRAIIEQGYTVIQEKTAENKLPDGWVVKKLGDVIEIIGGGTPKTSNPDYWGGGIPWLSVKDFNNVTRYVFTTDKYITEQGLENSSTKMLSKGDIIISARGTVGELAQLGKDMAFNQSCYGIRANNYSCNDFIYYLLKHKVSELKSKSHGSVFDTITRSTFDNLNVSLPPLNEQKEIAAILSSLDDKIELNQQINKKLEEMAQAIFKEWFIDFNFPDENGNPYRDSGGAMIDSELGQIPAAWSIKSLDEIAEFTNGLAMQKFRPTEHEKSLPVLKIKELRQGNTDINSDRCTIEIPDNVKISDGDVIFSWSGSLMIDLWTGGKAGLNQHLFKVTSDKYPKAFYYLWIKYYLARFIAIAQDKATTLGHIQRRHLTDAKVFCPNDKIMQKFNDVVTPIIEQIIVKNLEIRMLTNSRDTLLPKLILNGVNFNHYE